MLSCQFNHVSEREKEMTLLDLQGMEWKEEAWGGDQTNLCVDVSDVSVDISL
jgi:hypothetical protein